MTTQTLVDKDGRFIQVAGMPEKVVDPNRQYYLVPPTTIDYAAVHARFTWLMPQHAFVTIEQFRAGTLALLERVRHDPQIANLLNGAHLPLLFPQIEVGDYGTVLESVFLDPVGRSYVEAFPTRTFENWRKGELADKVSVVDSTRHHRLVEAIRRGPAVGLWFPTPFQGFSIPADRAMMVRLSEDILLCGGIEPAMGFVGYPAVLGRDGMTPVLDCAALQWQDPGYSLCFSPLDSYLGFGSRYPSAIGSGVGGVLMLWQP